MASDLEKPDTTKNAEGALKEVGDLNISLSETMEEIKKVVTEKERGAPGVGDSGEGRASEPPSDSDLEKMYLGTQGAEPFTPELKPEAEAAPVTPHEVVPPTPEQQAEIEKRLSVLEKLGEVWEKKGELLKIPDPVRKFGEYVNEHPKTRLGIGLGFGALAIATGGATFLASGAWRAVAGTGTFVAVEEWLRRDYEKATGEERSRGRAAFHTGAALAIAVLLGSSPYLVSAGTDLIEKISGGSIPQEVAAAGKGPEASGKISGVITAQAEMAVLPDYAVEKGDNLYKILRANFSEISRLEGGRQTNAIENIIEEIRKTPAEYGISSGNANTLSAGDKINMQKIAEILSEKKIGTGGIIEHAQNLSEETVKNIESYVPPTEEASLLTEDNDEIPPETGTEPVPQHIKEKWGEMTPEKIEGMKQEYNPPGSLTLEEISERNAIASFETPDREGVVTNISPADQVTLKIARESFYGKLDEFYGESSWFGFSKIPGAESETWKIFKDQSAVSIMDVEKPDENLAKLKGWIETLMIDAKMHPDGAESTDHFVKRALFAVSRTRGVDV